MAKPYSYIGIGNAAIDVICSVPDSFITELNLPKSSCAFPDAAGVAAIEAAIRKYNLKPVLEPGGCAANTASAMAALGDKAVFIGRTARDEYGRQFEASMDKWNISHPVAAMDLSVTSSTRVYTFITPDLDRTFASYQGAAHYLSPADLPEEMISQSACLYIDGYVLPEAGGRETALAALKLGHKHNVPCIFNPAALSVIEGWNDTLSAILAQADGVICNEQEAMAMTGAPSATSALEILAKRRKFAAVTLGIGGAAAIAGDDRAGLSNPPLARPIINTNGAGDNFAAGFIYGFVHGWSTQKSVTLGLRCAVNVLGETGPRPVQDLRELLQDL